MKTKIMNGPKITKTFIKIFITFISFIAIQKTKGQNICMIDAHESEESS